jgi:hypothetical protein
MSSLIFLTISLPSIIPKRKFELRFVLIRSDPSVCTDRMGAVHFVTTGTYRPPGVVFIYIRHTGGYALTTTTTITLSLATCTDGDTDKR